MKMDFFSCNPKGLSKGRGTLNRKITSRRVEERCYYFQCMKQGFIRIWGSLIYVKIEKFPICLKYVIFANPDSSDEHSQVTFINSDM